MPPTSHTFFPRVCIFRAIIHSTLNFKKLQLYVHNHIHVKKCLAAVASLLYTTLYRGRNYTMATDYILLLSSTALFLHFTQSASSIHHPQLSHTFFSGGRTEATFNINTTHTHTPIKLGNAIYDSQLNLSIITICICK
jgi:hypothetical protein